MANCKTRTLKFPMVVGEREAGGGRSVRLSRAFPWSRS